MLPVHASPFPENASTVGCAHGDVNQSITANATAILRDGRVNPPGREAMRPRKPPDFRATLGFVVGRLRVVGLSMRGRRCVQTATRHVAPGASSTISAEPPRVAARAPGIGGVPAGSRRQLAGRADRGAAETTAVRQPSRAHALESRSPLTPPFPRTPLDALVMAQDRAHYAPERIGQLFEDVEPIAREAAAAGRDFSATFCAHAYARTIG